MKVLRLLLPLLLCVRPLGAEELRILTVGRDCPDPQTIVHLKALAAESHPSLELVFAHPDTQLSTRQLRRTVRRGRWDITVLGEEYWPSARRLRGTRVMLRMPWAFARNYIGDVSVDPRFRQQYACDQDSMYADILSRCAAAARGRYEVIPVGTAVQDVRATWDRDNITRDGVHLNYSIGCFTEACTWYESIFGQDVRESAYDPGRLYPERLSLARAAAHAAVRQPFEVTDFGWRRLDKNYKEDKVPSYTLPDPLVMADGTRVRSVAQWYDQRRPELLEMFETKMYGRAPGRPEGEHFEVISEDTGALGGTAIRREVKIYFTEGDDHYMTLLLYIPKHVKGPVPAFLGANFFGNATIWPDGGISYPDSAQVRRYTMYSEHPRGEKASRWPLGLILERGYALATFHKSDLAPEYDNSFIQGVFPLFYRDGQDYPDPDQWGNIAAWAWGYSRALDYLETDADVDASRVAATGHSRLAKTALWAAVEDERFAMACPNNPGCGGAAISRRAYGETLETIVRHYHYWFCGNFAAYAGKEADLPFDQHELVALMAPRPVCVGSGEHDRWSDPVGEFEALREASRVYEFLGLEGLGAREMPGPWKPLQSGRIGYHMRSGPHEITPYDWGRYLDFADKYLKNGK